MWARDDSVAKLSMSDQEADDERQLKAREVSDQVFL